MELKDSISNLLLDSGCGTSDECDDLADRILAIPEIEAALLLMKTAQRRFGEAAQQVSPYAQAHPWANLLQQSDMPPRV